MRAKAMRCLALRELNQARCRALRMGTSKGDARTAYWQKRLQRPNDHHIRIFGRKDVLERAALSNGVPVPGVRGLVRNWRPVGESNPCFQRERLTS
jgi:hypothetical protein